MSDYRRRKAARTPRTRELLIDPANLRCPVHFAPPYGCGCWKICPCGWPYEEIRGCRNPNHRTDAQAAGDDDMGGDQP